MGRRITTIALCSALALAAVAFAAADRRTLRNVRTWKLAAGRERSFLVAYPDALQYGGSRYSGRVRILPPAPGAHGTAPSLNKVRVIHRGSIDGSSGYSAEVVNHNRKGTAPVRVRITAATTLPAGR